MAQKFSNAARAELSAPLSPGDTSLTLVSGGELFPVANTGTNAISNSYDWFKVVVQDSYGYEIMYVRTHALNGLVLSNILRAQENTTALYFEAGTTVGLRPTAGDMNEAVNNRVEKIAGKGLSSEDYSSADKAKLAGIAANANNYEHPTTEGNRHLPPIDASTAGKFVQSSGIPGNYGWVGLNKSLVGLDNVDNTSDAGKPVSTAQAAAISASTATNTHAATSKTTPVDADELGLSDSAASWGLKKLTFANLKSWIGSLFVSKSGDTINGDLNFGGTARRITGDFSNATIASRTAFQTSTANGNTFVHAYPNGTAAASGVIATTNSDATNYSSTEVVATPQASILRSGQAGTGVTVPLELNIATTKCMRLDPTNFAFTSVNGPIGYGTGAGGTVTQATSKTTAVTLNKPSGFITMNNAALAAGAVAAFSLNNSFIGAHDLVVVQPTGGGIWNEYQAWVSYGATGLCLINVRNNSADSRSDPIGITFAIYSGATS